MNQKTMGPLSDAAYAKMLGITPEALKMRAEDAAKKDMDYREYNALRYLTACISALPLVQQKLQKRCRESGKWTWSMLRSATGILCKVFDTLVKTVPSSKLPQLKKELNRTHFDVTTSSSDKECVDGVNYVCMREDTAIKICKKAMEIDCVMCEKSWEESLRCPLRKLINESLMFNPPRPDTDNCIYSQGDLRAVEGRNADELLEWNEENDE